MSANEELIREVDQAIRALRKVRGYLQAYGSMRKTKAGERDDIPLSQ